jgi:PAS domain S-box-containing protein
MPETAAQQVNAVNPSQLRAYGAAILLVAAALFARWLLDPLLGDRLPFVTFFVAAAAAMVYAGLLPAILTTVLGGFLALLFFVPPQASILLTATADLVAMFMYVSLTVCMLCFGHALLAARRHAIDARHDARQQRDLLHQTLVSIGDAVITTDQTGNVTLLNPVAEALTGWSNEEARGKPLNTVFRIIHENTRQPLDNPVDKVWQTGAVVGLANHTLLISRSGREYQITDSAAPIMGDENDIAGVVLVFRDVSEKRADDRKIVESEARKSAMLESALDGIVGIDDKGRIIEFNPAAAQMLGYRREDALGRDMAELIIPSEVRDRHHQGMARYLASGDEKVLNRLVELTAMTSSGTRIPVEVSITRIKQGSRPAFVGYIRDISERKRGERELKRREERLHALTSATISIVWVTDADGSFIDEQPSWSDYTGQAWEDYRGTGWIHAIHRDDRKDVMAAWNNARLRKSPYRSHGRLWHAASAAFRHFEARAVPLLDEGGLVKEWVGSCHDIDKEKQLDKELRDTVQQLSLANHRKNELLAMLAHELRNPLAPLQNSLEIIKRPDIDEVTSTEAQEVMARQLRQMTRLVDDLLDISRITYGKFVAVKSQVQLSPIIRQAVETVRPLLDSKRHYLSIEEPADPVLLFADAQRLAQVVGNLLRNSAEFTPEGGKLGIAVTREDAHVNISVKDNGVGIDASQLGSIFELLVQADDSANLSNSGLGIGLTLVKKIVEMHDGEISAHSGGPGKGSEFVVRLPVATSDRQMPSAPATSEIENRDAAKSRRILLVDDNRDSADSLAQLLKLHGHETGVAYGGQECVDAVDEFEPEILILDIGMPGMSGYDVARQLRKSKRGGRVYIIALSGWGEEADLRNSFKAGFDHHFVKPVELDTLINFMAKLPPERNSVA